MLTCKKIYRDIPFAHRQHVHDNHCSFIHGHNWAIGLTFACRETDENGFVVDFGKLHFLRNWIDEHLDHACLFNDDDLEREALIAAGPTAWKTYILENCSCEGIAQHLFHLFNGMVKEQTDGRVWITEVEVAEDSKNSATYSQ